MSCPLTIRFARGRRAQLSELATTTTLSRLLSPLRADVGLSDRRRPGLLNIQGRDNTSVALCSSVTSPMWTVRCRSSSPRAPPSLLVQVGAPFSSPACVPSLPITRSSTSPTPVWTSVWMSGCRRRCWSSDGPSQEETSRQLSLRPTCQPSSSQRLNQHWPSSVWRRCRRKSSPRLRSDTRRSARVSRTSSAGSERGRPTA